MRIQQLDLLAFGPFTDVSLRFGDTGGALHIVYGANEAGKSSALRALRCFLYGIPNRSTDAFLHPYDALRVGATLSTDRGEVLTLTRRKGRNNTLREVDDTTVVADEVLSELLQGIDEETFRLRFGIDYESLTLGGRAIVEGHGDLAKSLFSAATGVARLGSVQQRLHDRAEGLFKTRGVKPQINANLRLYQQTLQELHEAELENEQLQEHRAALGDAETQRSGIERLIEQCEKRAKQLERIVQAIPLAEQRARLITQIEMQKNASVVDDQFHQQRKTWEQQKLRAESQLKQASEELEQVDRQLSEASIDSSIFERAKEIESLYQRLSSYDDARSESVRLESFRRQQEEQLAELLPPDIDVGEAAPHVDADMCHELQEMVAQKTTLDARHDADALALREKRSQREQIPDNAESEVATESENADLEPLRTVLRQTQQNTEFAARKEIAQQLRRQESDLAGKLDRLQLWSGHPAQLLELELPEAETIVHFQRELQAASQRTTQLQKKLAMLRSGLDDKLRQVEQLRDQYDLPTEEDLEQTRALRDVTWQQVLERWQGQAQAEDYPESDADLIQRMQEATDRADTLSDRMRRESSRIGEHRALTNDCQKLQAEHDATNDEFSEAVRHKQQVEKEWDDLWETSGIRPLTPTEMENWVEEVAGAKQLMGEMTSHHQRLDAIEREIVTLGHGLQSALQGLQVEVNAEASFEELLSLARRTLNSCENEAGRHQIAQHQRRSLDTEIQKLAARVSEHDRALEAWRARWDEFIAARKLTLLASAESPALFLQRLTKLAASLRDAEDVKQQLDRHASTIRTFESAAESLRERWQQEPKEPREAVRAWYDQLAEVSAHQAKVAHWQSRQSACRRQLASATGDLDEAKLKLEGLCQQAGCSSLEDLDRLEQQSRALSALRSDLENCESQLSQLSGQGEVETLLAAATTGDAVLLRDEIKSLDAEVADLAGQRRELSQLIGRLHSKVEQHLDGGSRVAGLQSDAQCLLAALEDDIGRYMRYRLAADVLAASMESFRTKSQGPLMERASEVFQRLTLGGFSGLQPDYDNDGQAVLVGVRPGGMTVDVDHMSEGTCDQLYLALRVASLEHYVENHAPLPLVLDDVLIKFDDQRSAAALEVFAELAQRTQVVFFTHHEHLLELASQRLGVDQLHIHRLDGRSTKRSAKPRKPRRRKSTQPGQGNLFQT